MKINERLVSSIKEKNKEKVDTNPTYFLQYLQKEAAAR